MIKISSFVKSNLLFYTLVFITIFISNKTLLFGTNEIEAYSMVGTYLSNIILFIMSIGLMFFKRKILTQHDIMTMMLFYFFIVFSGIANSNLRIGYGFMLLMIMTGLFFTKVMSFLKFIRIFEDIIFVIALYSIIIYTLAFLDIGILSKFPTIVNTNNYLFINCWLCCIPISMQFQIPRLFGPFSEPGIFQIYLNLAILFHCIRNKEISIVRILIFLVALVLTFSTTGYIACCIVFIFLFLQLRKGKSSSRKGYLLMLIITTAIIVLSVTTDILSPNGMVFNKFGNDARSTTAARMGSIWGNISIWATHPIFGVGITALPFLFEEYCVRSYGVSTQSNTNSILVPFAMFGMFYGSLCVKGFWKLSTKCTNGRGKSLLLFGSVLLMLAGENITENVLFYILIMYGITPTFKKIGTELS